MLHPTVEASSLLLLTPIATACLLQDISDVGWIEGHRPRPESEAAVIVYGLRPLVEEPPLRSVLLGILALDLQDQHRPVRKADEKVGDVLLHPTLVGVENLEAKVVVLGPCHNLGVAVKLERRLCFPGAVAHGSVDVGLLCGLGGLDFCLSLE